MKALLTIFVTMIATSSAYALGAKCTVLAAGVPLEEKDVEIIGADMNGHFTVFGDFSLKIEIKPSGEQTMVLIDSRRGALATAPMNNDTKEGQVKVGIVDQSWRFHITGTATCRLP